MFFENSFVKTSELLFIFVHINLLSKWWDVHFLGDRQAYFGIFQLHNTRKVCQESQTWSLWRVTTPLFCVYRLVYLPVENLLTCGKKNFWVIRVDNKEPSTSLKLFYEKNVCLYVPVCVLTYLNIYPFCLSIWIDLFIHTNYYSLFYLVTSPMVIVDEGHLLVRSKL